MIEASDASPLLSMLLRLASLRCVKSLRDRNVSATALGQVVLPPLAAERASGNLGA